MYAIIETGGKQYRVEKGDIIQVERCASEPGEKVTFKNVLFADNSKTQVVGAPHVEKASVLGEFLQEVKGPKVIAYKYKKRKNYRKKKGHRQKYSAVKITDIKLGAPNGS